MNETIQAILFGFVLIGLILIIMFGVCELYLWNLERQLDAAFGINDKEIEAQTSTSPTKLYFEPIEDITAFELAQIWGMTRPPFGSPNVSISEVSQRHIDYLKEQGLLRFFKDYE